METEVPVGPLARRCNSSHSCIMILMYDDCLYSSISRTSFKPSWLLSDTKETIQFHTRISSNSVSLFHDFSFQQEITILWQMCMKMLEIVGQCFLQIAEILIPCSPRILVWFWGNHNFCARFPQLPQRATVSLYFKCMWQWEIVTQRCSERGWTQIYREVLSLFLSIHEKKNE